MDALLAAGLAVVGALVKHLRSLEKGRSRCLKMVKRSKISWAHLETPIAVDEVRGLPVVLIITSSPDESARTHRQVAAKQVEGVPRALAEDEEAWCENRRTDKS